EFLFSKNLNYQEGGTQQSLL
ncbi:unnamed protein product, partial [Allacma fusca]